MIGTFTIADDGEAPRRLSAFCGSSIAARRNM